LIIVFPHIFRIEPVKLVYPDGSSRMCPDMSPRLTTVSASYINDALGISITASEICSLLAKMCILATPSGSDADILDIQIPPTRPDIFHSCDLMEDVGIAYNINKIKKSLPVTNTVAKPFAVNRLADVIRKECAMAGWVEVLPLILVSAVLGE
jgi:phenylalanyl-tRNA synthetase beta chain